MQYYNPIVAKKMQAELLLEKFDTGEWLNPEGRTMPRIYSSSGKAEINMSPFNRLLLSLFASKFNFDTAWYISEEDAKKSGISVRNYELGEGFPVKTSVDGNDKYVMLYNLIQTELPEKHKVLYQNIYDQHGTMKNDFKFHTNHRNAVDSIIDNKDTVAASLNLEKGINVHEGSSTYYHPVFDTIFIGTDNNRGNVGILQDYYRAMSFAITESENRLGFRGENYKVLDGSPKYDNYQTLVSELASAIKMNDLGFSASIREDSNLKYMKLLKDNISNPDFLSKLEKDVNDTVDIIERAERGEKIDYSIYKDSTTSNIKDLQAQLNDRKAGTEMPSVVYNQLKNNLTIAQLYLLNDYGIGYNFTPVENYKEGAYPWILNPKEFCEYDKAKIVDILRPGKADNFVKHRILDIYYGFDLDKHRLAKAALNEPMFDFIPNATETAANIDHIRGKLSGTGRINDSELYNLEKEYHEEVNKLHDMVLEYCGVEKGQAVGERKYHLEQNIEQFEEDFRDCIDNILNPILMDIPLPGQEKKKAEEYSVSPEIAAKITNVVAFKTDDDEYYIWPTISGAEHLGPKKISLSDWNNILSSDDARTFKTYLAAELYKDVLEKKEEIKLSPGHIIEKDLSYFEALDEFLNEEEYDNNIEEDEELDDEIDNEQNEEKTSSRGFHR